MRAGEIISQGNPLPDVPVFTYDRLPQTADRGPHPKDVLLLELIDSPRSLNQSARLMMPAFGITRIRTDDPLSDRRPFSRRRLSNDTGVAGGKQQDHQENSFHRCTLHGVR
jgi:hypothetical protein